MPENPNPLRALLVSIRTPEISETEARESVCELERLVTTLGFRVVGHQSQRLKSTMGATAVGSGKLWELAQFTRKSKIDPDSENSAPAETAEIVIFDCDLRPSQMRHLESVLQVEVLDRTGVIIEIFSRHAKTQAARLQIEIARLKYLSPRIREAGSSGERQAGRGSGESALETERRRIRDRLAELKRNLEKLQKHETDHRENRNAQPTAALVGYTNAGKSSLMRALTGSEVLVEDKLFATLDTTVRAIKPETQPRILVSDTVGFIKKLPHDLVASFRSTLEEAKNASLLLYIVDASDPSFRSQLDVVEDVLRYVGVRRTPGLLVLNKSDLIDSITRKRLLREFPKAILLSTLEPEAVAALRLQIIDFFDKSLVEQEIFAPYALSGILGEIRARTRILEIKHEQGGTRIRLKAMPEELSRLQKLLQGLRESAQ